MCILNSIASLYVRFGVLLMETVDLTPLNNVSRIIMSLALKSSNEIRNMLLKKAYYQHHV